LKIIVCYKLVPNEQDIIIKSDRTLDFSKAEWKIGEYDFNAIEAGMQISESVNAEVSAISIGQQISINNSKLKKAALSRGPNNLYLIADDALAEADCYSTAAVLASMVRKIGDVDLVLCGEGSGDIYAQQVGTVLGQMLGFATLNAISNLITIGEDRLCVERSLENEIEVLEVDLPAVLSVTADINRARIPSLKDIMAAGKKPVTMWTLEDVCTVEKRKTAILSTLAPEETDRKNIIIEDDSPENIDKFFDLLFSVTV
jgi:electron transfer flavoprotein beta subunit